MTKRRVLNRLKLSLTGHVSTVRAVAISDRHAWELAAGKQCMQLYCRTMAASVVQASVPLQCVRRL